MPRPVLVALSFRPLEYELNDHELIKVRVQGMERDARDEALALLAGRTGSELVGRIGHTAVFYRRHPEKPRIAIPSQADQALRTMNI